MDGSLKHRVAEVSVRRVAPVLQRRTYRSASRPDDKTPLPRAIPPIARKTILQGYFDLLIRIGSM